MSGSSKNRWHFCSPPDENLIAISLCLFEGPPLGLAVTVGEREPPPKLLSGSSKDWWWCCCRRWCSQHPTEIPQDEGHIPLFVFRRPSARACLVGLWKVSPNKENPGATVGARHESNERRRRLRHRFLVIFYFFLSTSVDVCVFEAPEDSNGGSSSCSIRPVGGCRNACEANATLCMQPGHGAESRQKRQNKMTGSFPGGGGIYFLLCFFALTVRALITSNCNCTCVQC